MKSAVSRGPAVAGIAISVGFWLGGGGAAAHGTVDQQNGPGPGDSTSVNSIFYAESIGQSFVPSVTSLVAADIAVGIFAAEGDPLMTMRIRDESYVGPILAEVSQSVGEDLPDAWVHFDFPTAVTVVPGQSYVIQMETTNNTHGWLRIENDPYPAGHPVPGDAPFDFTFRTYSLQATPSPTPSPTPEPTPSPSPTRTPTPEAAQLPATGRGGTGIRTPALAAMIAGVLLIGLGTLGAATSTPMARRLRRRS